MVDWRQSDGPISSGGGGGRAASPHAAGQQPPNNLSRRSRPPNLLSAAAEHSKRAGIQVLGYCLMTNHVHLVAIPERADSFARGLGRAHYLYTRWLHERWGGNGHLWQNRFFSCPLDRDHLWTALRYVDLNPLRAGLVGEAAAYEWSSARAHVERQDPLGLLDGGLWGELCGRQDWREMLGPTRLEGSTCHDIPLLVTRFSPPKRPLTTIYH